MKVWGNENQIFKNVFPDYDTFSTWYKASGLSSGTTDVPSQVTFTLIANEYNSNHIAFSVEEFKQKFANDLYTFYPEFEQTTNAIKELMKLSEEDISIDGAIITNVANIPETDNDTDTETVDFVSTQQKTINKKGTLQIKKELLSNKRTFTTRTFIKRFKHLFVKVCSSYLVDLYCEEDDD